MYIVPPGLEETERANTARTGKAVLGRCRLRLVDAAWSAASQSDAVVRMFACAVRFGLYMIGYCAPTRGLSSSLS